MDYFSLVLGIVLGVLMPFVLKMFVKDGEEISAGEGPGSIRPIPSFTPPTTPTAGSTNVPKEGALAGEDSPSTSSLGYAPTHRLAAEALETLEDMYRLADETDGWAPLASKKGVDIETKPLCEGVISVRGRGRVEAPPRCVLEVVADADPGRTKDWDAMFDEGGIIERLDDNCTVCWNAFEAPMFVTPRDFLVLAVKNTRPDGVCGFANRSIEDERFPPRSSHVRAKSVAGGFVIRPVSGDPMASDVSFVTLFDPCGSLPSWVVNKASATKPMCINGLRKVVLARFDDMSAFMGPPPQ